MERQHHSDERNRWKIFENRDKYNKLLLTYCPHTDTTHPDALFDVTTLILQLFTAILALTIVLNYFE